MHVSCAMDINIKNESRARRATERDPVDHLLYAMSVVAGEPLLCVGTSSRNRTACSRGRIGMTTIT